MVHKIAWLSLSILSYTFVCSRKMVFCKSVRQSKSIGATVISSQWPLCILLIMQVCMHFHCLTSCVLKQLMVYALILQSVHDVIISLKYISPSPIASVMQHKVNPNWSIKLASLHIISCEWKDYWCMLVWTHTYCIRVQYARRFSRVYLYQQERVAQ